MVAAWHISFINIGTVLVGQAYLGGRVRKTIYNVVAVTYYYQNLAQEKKE